MAAGIPQDREYTAEEAIRLDPFDSWELVDGRFVVVTRPSARHGWMMLRVGRLLADFVEAHDLGVVMAGDPGFILRRRPDTLRGPDVAFVRKQRLSGPIPDECLEGPPDLAVEIVSRSDSWPAIARKADDYLAAGCVAVWAIDSDSETARIYTGDGERILAGTDALACPALLGDFEIRLGDLWR
ncbi:MAG TPA: Uma2 family endonuclease [Polyangia bacterium]|jgi:Uma2 family endonuclease